VPKKLEEIRLLSCCAATVKVATNASVTTITTTATAIITLAVATKITTPT